MRYAVRERQEQRALGNLTTREKEIKAMHEAASQKRAAAASRKARIAAARGRALPLDSDGRKGGAR